MINDGFVFASSQRQLPQPEWWIEDLITRNSVTMLSCQPKEGKSCFASELTFCTCTGRDFFGRKVPQGTVLYLAGERASQVEDRIFSLFEREGEEPRNYAVFVPSLSSLGPIKLNRDGGSKDVDRLITKIGQFSLIPSLIIVDTLSQFFDTSVGSQSDDKAMHPFMAGARKLADTFNTQVLILHHDIKLYQDKSGKVFGGGSPRGSGDAFASVDTLLRAKTTLRVKELDNPKKEVRVVNFYLEADNFGGYFEETVAVKKHFEDPEPYYKALADQKAEKLDTMKDKMIEALPDDRTGLTESKWKEDYKKLVNKSSLSNRAWEAARDELVTNNQVLKQDNPNRKNGFLYFRA